MENIDTGSPVISFKPIEIPSGEKHVTPSGAELELVFQGIRIEKEDEEVVTEAICNGYDYLSSVLGQGISSLSKKYIVELTSGENFMHGGILMKFPESGIKSLKGDPSYERDRTQSLVVHELVHSITPYEDLPMFAEMIYIVEKGHPERINEIGRFLSEGKLKKQYVSGLSNIANWLGSSSPEELVREFSRNNLDYLKAKLAKELVSYSEIESGQ